MEGGAMSEYERLRAENIARNARMLAQLGVDDAARNLHISREKKQKPKGYKPEKKRARDEPVVLRRSLRIQGTAPEMKPMNSPEREFIEAEDSKKKKKTTREIKEYTWEHPVKFKELLIDEESDNAFCTRIVQAAEEQPISLGKHAKQDVFDPSKMKLDEKDVARVVPEKIYSLVFLPLQDRSVVAAGDKQGHVGIWDADHNEDSVHIYHPHTSPVCVMQTAFTDVTKITTCSYDGNVLFMDIEKALFSKIYSGDTTLTAMSYTPEGTICIGEEQGEVKLFDPRSPEPSSVLKAHEKRINSIDFNTTNTHIFATSSTDATVCVWDVRNMSSIASMSHRRAVHSAYFSPSGQRLVSTSYDNTVGLWSGKQNDKPAMISHNNQTNRWIATFKAIWSSSDEYVYISNMLRAIDVISTREKKMVASLKSEDMTSIPSRLAQHPLLPGVVAGGAAGGKVFVWRS